MDKNAPRITVDAKGYDEKHLPTAVVGKPYPIFAASAFDVDDGNVNVSVCAVMIDSKGKEYVFDVTDGGFTPFIDGDYVIRYTARNSSGVCTVKRA